MKIPIAATTESRAVRMPNMNFNIPSRISPEMCIRDRYYTSECDESQSLTITVEDNFGNACEWELEFNNDSDAET